MRGSGLIAGLVLLVLGGGLVRHGTRVLRGGADRLRSARARAAAEAALGGVFALLGATTMILAVIGGHRLPTVVGTAVTVSLLVLFAAAGCGSLGWRAAAWHERREARRADRELGLVRPRDLWSLTTIGVMWGVVCFVVMLAWAVTWAITERVWRHPERPASQHTIDLSVIVLVAVICTGGLHMAIQRLRLRNRAGQLAWPAATGEDERGSPSRLMVSIACPALWCSGEQTWVRRVNRQRAVRAPVMWLARTGVSSTIPAPPLPGWATAAWILDRSRWSVAIWRVDLASGDARITTIGVARPGRSRALALVRAVAGHPLLASLAFLAGVIATGLAWPPAATIYVIVVGGALAGAGVIVPLLRGDCRTASGEQLGPRGERGLADLRTSGEDLEAWRRLWTALPVPPPTP